MKLKAILTIGGSQTSERANILKNVYICESNKATVHSTDVLLKAINRITNISFLVIFPQLPGTGE